MQQIITMPVLKNVAKLLFTFLIPILAKIVVKEVNIAPKKDKTNHIISTSFIHVLIQIKHKYHFYTIINASISVEFRILFFALEPYESIFALIHHNHKQQNIVHQYY